VARLQPDRRPVNGALQNFIHQARVRSELKSLAKTSTAVTPAKFLRLLRRRLQRDAILVTDSGTHQSWALNDFPIYTGRSFLAPADYQAMGFSIPAAIAAKLAYPGRQVVSLVGDGGFLMSRFEAMNAARWNAKITIVVFREGAGGLMKEAQQRIDGRAPFTDIPASDFGQLAQSLGLEHVRVASDAGIEEALNRALNAKGSALVEARVDYAEPPPHVKGVAPQRFRNLVPRLKAGIAPRLGKRQGSLAGAQ